LGKTIVDGGVAWTYSPAFPRKPPPFASVQELLGATQTEFWAVHMGKPPAYDPVNETEYMVRATLADAEADEVLTFLVSTYDPERDRMVPGLGTRGPRVLDFSPLLVQEQFPFLQVRSMVVSDQAVEVSLEDLSDPHCIVSSDRVMGNGTADDIHDILFVQPDRFSVLQTPAIARELEEINRELREQQRPYLLIGFGRWGSSHPSLGIPVDWSQISGARAIVEATLPQMNVELSQGSHFFHNLSSFRVSYFMVQRGHYNINWDWLNQQPLAHDGEFVRHVRPRGGIRVRVDGRSRRGVILSSPDSSEQTQ
jgi:hypothetical protein